MRATGIVYRIDELGRIAIPKPIRDMLDIKENGILEHFVDKGKLIMKYNKDVKEE